MTDSNIFNLNKPDQNAPLQEILREGARKMLAAAIEAEVAAFIEQYSTLKTDEGKLAVARNDYLPERPIQTGLGNIEVKVPKVRDCSESGIKFNSSLVPPYLKRTRNIEEFLPWLYLRGISTGDFSETLKHLLGPGGTWIIGVYSNVRIDDRLCLLVIVGSDETGRKELLALSDSYRESAAS